MSWKKLKLGRSTVVTTADSKADKIYHSEAFQKLFTDVSSKMPSQQKGKNAENNSKRAENIINEVKKQWKGEWLPELHDKMMEGMF